MKSKGHNNETLWGSTIILDNPKRRNYNVELVDLIINKEKNCLHLLQRFIGKVKKQLIISS